MSGQERTWIPPQMAVAADVVVIGRFKGLRVLLVQRRNEPFKGHWALPGGFVELDEDLEPAARRELLEETGLTVGHLNEVGVFGKPGRDPRGRTVTVVYSTFVDGGTVSPVAGDDAARVDWFALNDLPPLAFDHAEVLNRVLGR